MQPQEKCNPAHPMSRVQFLEICHAILMRYLRFLCLLDLLTVRGSSDHQAVVGFSLQALSRSLFFHRQVRRFFTDYGMSIALVASSGVAYWGRFDAAHPTTLPVGGAFDAAGGRSWLVKIWLLGAKWVGIAFPFGLALWVLFFDHNLSVRKHPFDKLSHIESVIVSHGAGVGVPSQEKPELPLRFLPAGNHNSHRRPSGSSCSQRSYPPSSDPHSVAGCLGSAYERKTRRRD